MTVTVLPSTSPRLSTFPTGTYPTSTVPPCRENDPDLWFSDSPTGVEEAKALCRGCPVVEQCLSGALERREPWGVWGGELFLAGVVVPRKRPRGRPRKNHAAA